MNNKKFNFLITNFVTLLRVIGIFALIPVFKIYGGFATFMLSASCFLTDCIDGLMARELKSSTFFGSLFDALSDKAFLVVNMILLMSISPLAIVPVFFELGIAYVQSVKYNKGMNIKSNMFGKVKMWIAGIIISMSYLLVDKEFLNYLGSNLAINMNDLNEIKLFSVLFMPLVLSEILTLGSYIKEYFDENKKMTPEFKNTKEEEEKKIEEEISNVSFKEIMFEHEYYEKYKDYGNLKLVRTLSRKNR
jgi:phosphatidylglycerophosphate synthase